MTNSKKCSEDSIFHKEKEGIIKIGLKGKKYLGGKTCELGVCVCVCNTSRLLIQEQETKNNIISKRKAIHISGVITSKEVLPNHEKNLIFQKQNSIRCVILIVNNTEQGHRFVQDKLTV